MRRTLTRLVPILTLVALGACGASNPAAPSPRPATWQAPVRLGPTEGAGTYLAEPAVATDGTGHALVTWGESRPSAGPDSRLGAEEVRASWFDPASGWGPAANVGGAGQIVPVIATLAMARDGRAVLVWRAPPNAVASFFSPRGSWTPPAVMPVTVFPQLALGPDGHALAVWPGVDDPAATPRWEHARLFSVDFTPEGFTPAEVVVASPTAGARADIDVDGSGNALAAWLEFRVPELPDAPPSVWTNRLVKGSGWGEPERLDALPESNGTSPIALDLDVHPDGHAVVAWEGAAGIEASLYGPGGWNTPDLIGPRNVGNLRVAMSAGGRAVAIWVTEHGIQAVEFRPGRGWGATQDVDDTPVGEPHFDRGWIELGLDEVGGGWALWATQDRAQACPPRCERTVGRAREPAIDERPGELGAPRRFRHRSGLRDVGGDA